MVDSQRSEGAPAGQPTAEEPIPAVQRPALGQRLLRVLRDIAETVIPALLIVLVINVFVARATSIEMQSMEPTLHETQRLIIEKISYRLHPPRRGDIVVFRLPNLGPKPLIKRVIALPGETIEITGGQVYINGEVLSEPYLHQATNRGIPPTVVPEGMVFVMGDNRGFSNDSRYFGPVPISAIEGHAWFRYWPLSALGMVH